MAVMLGEFEPPSAALRVKVSVALPALVRVKEPTCDTMVSTLLDLVSCRILAPSMKVAKAWLPMLVPAGGAAAWAVPPPNAIKAPSIVVPNHVVMDLRPPGGGLV